MRLPRSAYLTIEYLRSTFSAGGSTARVGRSATHPNHPLTVLVQASQLLWLVNIHDNYKCSLTLTLASYPTPPGPMDINKPNSYWAIFSKWSNGVGPS